MSKKVIIVGGGVAGMQAAVTLRSLGIDPVIIEREEKLGGKLNDWHKLFPVFTPTDEVLSPLIDQVESLGIEVRTGAEAESVSSDGVTLKGGEKISGDAVVIGSGFDIFDARRKEEYGYGIYDNVFTTIDIEKMFKDGKVVTAQGKTPQRIALLHCVGSRDEKVGAHHCSRVCCITGVKQAVELKEMFPACEIYNFYMDIRMFGPGYEELYREAQLKHNINFIRGRISEASQTIDRRVQIKAEDTLIGRPLKMTVDMLILIVGMEGGRSNTGFVRNSGLTASSNGFMRPYDIFHGNVNSEVSGVFYAGSVTSPKNIGESINSGIAAATRVAEYLRI